MSRPRYIRPDPGARVPATAMVMAAGIGKRMRPLTATRPKPLIEVAGRTLLDHVFDRLRAAGVADVVLAHLLELWGLRRCGDAARLGPLLLGDE